MRPFIILALPRTGTKMLVSAMDSHPDMPKSVHEFRGSFWRFLKHPYVLSNKIQWWMRWPIKIMHVGREDSKAGALSLLKMSYKFPAGSYEIPKEEVDKLEKFRREAEGKMRQRAHWSITYEKLTGGQDVRELALSVEICNFFNIRPRALMPTTEKIKEMPASNEAELWAV